MDSLRKAVTGYIASGKVIFVPTHAGTQKTLAQTLVMIKNSQRLPYEIVSYIVEHLDIKDVANLAKTCKKLQYLEREEDICKKFLKAKVPYSEEVLGASRPGGGGFASAFRRIIKCRESIATANPYSVAIVGFCDSYLYSNGVLCYTLDDKLRIIDLHNSQSDETVVHIPTLLREFFPDADERIRGRFQILYYNDGLVSCLYKSSSNLDSVAHLIVLDLRRGQVILNYRLDSTEKLFVRHNSEVIYYGIYTGDMNDRYKKWVLRGYFFQKMLWFERIYLPELIGTDVGTTVCFEIIGNFFYALSSQTTCEVEEIDWTSFYHCARFPLKFPQKSLIEKTLEDKHMWRRQHREGPIDDRWATLSLCINEESRDVNIVETRKEFKSGASTSRRTSYITKVVFPEAQCVESPIQHFPTSSMSSVPSSQLVSSATIVSPATSSNSLTETLERLPTSFPKTRPGKYELAAATNDRLALTLTESDNPHWFPTQNRLPRNIHPHLDGEFVLAQTPIRHYNVPAASFIDLVDDRTSNQPEKSRLRLRTASRYLEPPVRDSYGLVIKEQKDPLTREILPGYNESYKLKDVAFWPPDPSPDGMSADALKQLDTVLNPPNHQGIVTGTADSRSLVYVTGDKQPNHLKAIIFINFDPTIRLSGLRSWNYSGKKSSFQNIAEDATREERAACIDTTCQQILDPVKSPRLSSASGLTCNKGKEKATTATWDEIPPLQTNYFPLPITSQSNEGDYTPTWIWNEAAMYRAINIGFDFGRERSS